MQTACAPARCRQGSQGRQQLWRRLQLPALVRLPLLVPPQLLRTPVQLLHLLLLALVYLLLLPCFPGTPAAVQPTAMHTFSCNSTAQEHGPRS
jgi:hypothetical protein